MDINAKKYNDNATGLIPGVDRMTVRKTLIPFPPISEQKAIVEKTIRIMQYCNTLEQEIKVCKNNAELLMQSLLGKLFGNENNHAPIKQNVKKEEASPEREIKFDSKTINMKLQELLKEHGKLHAEDLWKMSEFPKDIDKFYAELKKQIEEDKTIKEVKNEKGYLELS